MGGEASAGSSTSTSTGAGAEGADDVIRGRKYRAERVQGAVGHIAQVEGAPALHRDRIDSHPVHGGETSLLEEV